MFQWLLRWLEKKNRFHPIKDRDGKKIYLNRWYWLWPDSVHRERKDIPFNSFIHQFMVDDESVFHDHPWNWYFTIVLKGGYWEHTPWGTYWRGPGHFRLVRGNKTKPFEYLIPHEGFWYRDLPADLHWIQIPEAGKTWTLFFRGRTVREWGFVPEPSKGTWIQHFEYLEQQRLAKNG